MQEREGEREQLGEDSERQTETGSVGSKQGRERERDLGVAGKIER